MHDISTQLGVESVSWPGDPPYERYLVSSIAKGDAAEARRRTPIPARRDAPAAPGEGVAAGNANPLGAGLPIGTPGTPVVPPVHPPACPVGAVFSLRIVPPVPSPAVFSCRRYTHRRSFRCGSRLPGIPPVGVLAALPGIPPVGVLAALPGIPPVGVLAALPGIPPVGVLAALGREFLLTPGLSRRAGSAPGFGLF